MNAPISITPTLLHSRYLISERLGENRLATVYRAEDQRLKRTVTVHVLRQELMHQPQLRQRFAEEAQRGAQRAHPGLLDVYDSGEAGGRPYMVMGYVEGRNLAEVGTLPVSTALNVVRIIIGAVATAQSRGAPHPLINSRNVLLVEGGRAVLLENWQVAPEELARDLALYRAPEQRRGEAPSPTSTVYALGMLAWEALVGHRPFDASAVETGGQQLPQIPAPSQARPDLFSPELDRVVMQALAPQPQHRFQAPSDFARTLDQYVTTVGAQTGRLAELPQGGVETQPLRRPARQVATGAALPPPATLHELPATKTLPARQPVASPQHGYSDQGQGQRQPERNWGQRVGRALLRAGLRLLLALLLLLGVYLGVMYAVDYARGQVQQVNIGEWISRQLPDIGAIVQIPNVPNIDDIVTVPDIGELVPIQNIDELLPSWLPFGGTETAVYRVVQPLNFRSEPSAASDATILRVLDAGTLMQQQGEPQADPDGQPYQWIPVIVLDDGSAGWIALQSDRLQRE